MSDPEGATRSVVPPPPCGVCGSQNEPDARFCHSCGASLTTSLTDEARKVVTVVFTDVVGSSALSQELDPESVRRMMTRYFREMKSILERHRGTVEKFIGDAVLAVFGIPQLHEDDALRAVRAAIEMREALRTLNLEFERTWGMRISTRTGVNTGEVVAGDPLRGDSFVVGEPVNVAARLEQSAQPGEILVGTATYHLVRDAVEAESLPPLSLKGHPEPVPAWRLLDVLPDAPGWTRRLDSPLVAREREIEALEEVFGLTVAKATCQLVTVLGSAGVGKSRLAAEFLSNVGDRATVLKGRCLPYGEGITFWPITEVLRDAAEIRLQELPGEARAKIAGLLAAGDDTALIGERLAALLGLAEDTLGIQETFWAVRRLFEHLGAQRPLVILFDDIQWGESTFLDLVEYLTDRKSVV